MISTTKNQAQFVKYVIKECYLIEEDRDLFDVAKIEFLEEQWESLQKLLKEMDDNNIYIDMEN